MQTNEKKQMSEASKFAYPKFLELFIKMPSDKQNYVLGYMQSEADRNVQANAHA